MRRDDGIVVQFMRDREERQVSALADTFQATKDAGKIWTRWGAWDRNPPVVALDGDTVIGFHAVMYGRRNNYVNSYYQGVDPSYQGRGIAGDMVRVMLAEAVRLRLQRLKFRAGQGSPGEAFWRGFGCEPFAEQHGEYIFDLDLSGLPAAIQLHGGDVIQGFIGWVGATDQHRPIPEKAMAVWRKLQAIEIYADRERV